MDEFEKALADFGEKVIDNEDCPYPSPLKQIVKGDIKEKLLSIAFGKFIEESSSWIKDGLESWEDDGHNVNTYFSGDQFVKDYKEAMREKYGKK